MSNVEIHAPADRLRRRTPRVADEHLAAVLAGTETLIFDGGMGTMLQAAGLEAGAAPELLCLTDPDKITAVHAAYVAAGSEVVTTNTFGANARKLEEGVRAAGLVRVPSVEQVFSAAVACARAAHPRYVAADIGPTGALLRPLGTLTFDEAYDLFAEQVRAGDAAGADLFIIETMADLLEAKAAVLAAKENSDLPVFCTMTFGEDGRTFLGTTPEVAAVTLSALGVDVLGVNCSLGPADVAPLVERMLPWATCPVMVQANAGLPSVEDGKTVYDIEPPEYCAALAPLVDAGVSVFGGCCGTTPAYIAGEVDLLAGRRTCQEEEALLPDVSSAAVPPATSAAVPPATLAAIPPAAPQATPPAAPTTIPPSAPLDASSTVPSVASPVEAATPQAAPTAAPQAAPTAVATVTPQATPTASALRPTARPFAVTSAQRLFTLAPGDVGVIGERINPTGKKRLKEALRTSNYDYIMGEAINQERAGAQVLDVNAGLPEIDEPATLVRLVEDLQGVTTLPLQIDSADPLAIEAAVRIYPGKPIINSTNGKQEVLDAVLPIARHYGCAVVGLALDEDGIPPTAEGRLAVARRIVEACEAEGIPRGDVLIDCLTMAVSTNQAAGRAILDAVRLVKAELPGVRCVLGVSNISFGLPFRELLNATFLTAAFEAGLDMAIMNPLSERFMDAVAAWRVFNGEDQNAEKYIGAYAGRTDGSRAPGSATGGAAGGAGPAGVGGSAGPANPAGPADPANPDDPREAIHAAVLQGRGEPVEQGVRELLNAGADPLGLVNGVLIPALDEVGERFEKGTFFLPQLMASAEAAKAGFEAIRSSAAAADVPSKGEVAICTVKGDIHDIGKNIVKMLLENYGYQVHDLGRDVDPQVFVDEVVNFHIELAGLSALMTTTVPAMAETIELLREQAPWCKVMVGGAVLNPEYAEMVGADFYAKDASESARIAGEVLG